MGGFAEEWIFTKRDTYKSIELLGSAGDQGKDGIGTIDSNS